MSQMNELIAYLHKNKVLIGRLSERLVLHIVLKMKIAHGKK